MKQSAWGHKQEKQTELHRIYRDDDGFVHTPRGYLAGEKYDELRLRAAQTFPKREDLPLLGDLSESEQKSFYHGKTHRRLT